MIIFNKTSINFSFSQAHMVVIFSDTGTQFVTDPAVQPVSQQSLELDFGESDVSARELIRLLSFVWTIIITLVAICHINP